MIAPRSASVASWMGTMLLLLLQSANAFQEPAFVAARRGGVGRRGVMGVAGQTMRRRIGALRGICFTCSWEGGYTRGAVKVCPHLRLLYGYCHLLF